MAKVAPNKTETKKSRPALTEEARESQLISLVMDRVEQQIRDGTASSQVLTHFLKLGSKEQKLKIQQLEEENKLLRAKTQAIENAENNKLLYEQAIKAMQHYQGHGDPDEYH